MRMGLEGVKKRKVGSNLKRNGSREGDQGVACSHIDCYIWVAV